MISLIVPVYNAEPYVREFLDSVVMQTFNDYEAIFIDDGSTDDSGKILDEYAKKYPNFNVIHQENQGVTKTWKRGVEISKGEYLAFADPDDIIKPDMLEIQYRLLVDNDVDMVITGITRFENGQYSTMEVDTRELVEGIYEGDSLEKIKENLFGNKKNRRNIFFFGKPNKLFKKSMVMNNLFYSLDEVAFGDDVNISASAIYDCKRLYYSRKELYIYRIHDNSITTENFRLNQIDDASALVESVRKLVIDKGYMNDFIYYNAPSYHIIRLMRKIKRTNGNLQEKKELLKTLKTHDFVGLYDLVKAKKYISKKRYVAIWLLKHSMFWLLLQIL